MTECIAVVFLINNICFFNFQCSVWYLDRMLTMSDKSWYLAWLDMLTRTQLLCAMYILKCRPNSSNRVLQNFINHISVNKSPNPQHNHNILVSSGPSVSLLCPKKEGRLHFLQTNEIYFIKLHNIPSVIIEILNH